MIPHLSTLLGRIEAGEIGEAEIYALERGPAGLPKRPRHGALLCPICGRSAARFLPFGLAGRRQACCPTCGSLERHRFLWWVLNRHTDLFRRRHRVLHTAPEPCLEDRLRRWPGLRYRSVDAYDPGADLRSSLTALPLATASQDVVLTSHVLEHIRDDRAALAELARVLRPGGWMAVMVPYDPALPATLEDADLDDAAERLRRFGHPYHFRIYGADLPDRIAAAGFDVRVLSSKASLSGHRRRRLRINRNYALLCTRRGAAA